MRVALLVLNIIGFILSIPNTLCVATCAGITGAATDAAALSAAAMDIEGSSSLGSLGDIIIGSATIIFVICIAAFVLGIMAYVKPKTTVAIIGGILLIVAGVLQLAFVLLGGILGLIAGICLVLAGVFAFTAKPEVAAPAPAA